MHFITEVSEEFNVQSNRYFNQGLAGRHQRALVHHYLSQQNIVNTNVLEMGCGMGEDFDFFVSKHCRVEASDLSRKMVHLCRDKIKSEEIPGIKVNVAGFHQLHLLYPNSEFDLAFSNFAGINQIDQVELSLLSKRLSLLLKEKGTLILVVKGKFALLESFFYFLRGQWRKAFQRQRNRNLSIRVTQADPIWFYTPRELKRLFALDFTVKKVQGIGLFIPPVVMNVGYEKRKIFSKIALKLDQIICRFSWSAYLSDHYLIHLEKLN